MLKLNEKRILVTGGAGFLGRWVVAKLTVLGCRGVIIPRSTAYNLTRSEAVRQLYERKRPDVVIHLAAVCGGIGANRAEPGRFFYENLIMGAHVIHEGMMARCVEKIVTVGTICAYPKFAPVPFREEDLWDGYPEETNAPYGIAKKALLVMSRAYRAQYGLNAIYLLPVNLFGEGDNFDPEMSHVIPAMIRKFVRGSDEVTLWGDGSPTREFLHVEDAAEAIVAAAERYDGEEPVNIGAGFEISMADLAEKIAKLAGFRGRIVWDASKPNGQPRRMLSTSRARERFVWGARIPFDEGLARTVAWYRGQLEPRGRPR